MVAREGEPWFVLPSIRKRGGFSLQKSQQVPRHRPGAVPPVARQGWVVALSNCIAALLLPPSLTHPLQYDDERHRACRTDYQPARQCCQEAGGIR